MQKFVNGAIALGVLAMAAPSLAASRSDAETCLIDGTSPEVRTVLEKNTQSGYKPAPEILKAFNIAMLQCEKKHGWTRQETFAAGAYAGFVLRYRNEERAALSRGVSPARVGALKSVASNIHYRNFEVAHAALRAEGYGSFEQFKTTSDFGLVEKWMGVLEGGRKLEAGG